MTKLLAAALLMLATLTGLWGQRHVDPKNTHTRIIAVVPLVGKGTPADPRRPEYAPWGAAAKDSAIIAFSFQETDDKKSAIVEYVARSRAAFQAILADKQITVFDKNTPSVAPTPGMSAAANIAANSANIETALKKYKKDFDITKFGTVVP